MIQINWICKNHKDKRKRQHVIMREETRQQYLLWGSWKDIHRLRSWTKFYGYNAVHYTFGEDNDRWDIIKSLGLIVESSYAEHKHQKLKIWSSVTDIAGSLCKKWKDFMVN